MTSDGLVIDDIKVSGGPPIQPGSTILLLYKVALSVEDLVNNRCVESTYSPDIPITVIVQEEALLAGVYKGLEGMRSGGSIRRLSFPSSMGFGERGYGPIPSGAHLYVELCAVSMIKPPDSSSTV